MGGLVLKIMPYTFPFFLLLPLFILDFSKGRHNGTSEKKAFQFQGQARGVHMTR